MSEKNYIHRLFDESLEFALQSKGAVVVVGPKWCGKSTTVSRQANTIIDLMPISTRGDYINMAKVAPSELLNLGKKPILIDEWQHISFIWDQIKYEVDKNGSFGQYILTGSVTDKYNNEFTDSSRHTGNGRIVRRLMRTMSLFESGESNGQISINELKNGVFKPAISDKTIYNYAYYICRGGWPLAIYQTRDIALAQARDYYEVLVTDDIFSLKDIPLKRDEQKARKVLRSYARNISISAADETLREDCISTDSTFDKDVFAKYLNALRNLYVIEELPAWNPNLRSKTAIRTKETRHFVDPSIGAAALGLTPEALFKDLTLFGLLFESLVIRDLRIYCDTLNARVYKYRDSKKREADAVIQFSDGTWALVEVKLGNEEDIKIASENLIHIASDIDYEKTGKPAFLMVVTKNKLAYKMENGVYVVPLACLKN
ncbi:MAG: ATP-binding protein [Acholeplasmatales bacterium]|jgi:predicted AAA+ superfamily ATPase|nr:ATP-binding protein [Acholeplasmatales bacterium]